MERKLYAILKNAVAVYSEEGLRERLASGRKLKIKLGADPTRPDLHLGHSVVLRALRVFQEMGHEVIFIIGDYTAMIGDPSGRIKTRPPLSFEETRKAGETYFRQAVKILDESRTRIEFNSTWLSRLAFAEVLRLAGTYTVARILERDDFKKRYDGGLPIGIHELMYPLMQGYDSVAVEADVELGGTDQTFNLMVGRELQKNYGQRPQEVVTFPLLIGLDGVEKMSKSLGNYIGLDERAEDMYEKAMKIPDPLLLDFFRLTTDVPVGRAEELVRSDIRAAHVVYAEEILTMYHGEGSVAGAARRYAKIAADGIPAEMPVRFIARTAASDNRIGILEALSRAGFASSKSEARRMIEGKGIKVDGKTVSDINFQLDLSEDKVIQFGKNRFVRLRAKDDSTADESAK